MSGGGRRTADFLAGSATTALLATGVVGASEALTHASSWLDGLAAVGFVMILGAPLGFVLVATGRLLWRAWRPPELAAAMRDPETGGAPRLAAWAAFLAIAASTLASLTLQVMVLVIAASSSPVVHALAAPMAAVPVAGFLAALSRPAVAWIARPLAALDRRLHRRTGRSFLTPTAVVAGSVVVAAGLCVLAWFVGIRPSVGHFDLSFAPRLALWLALLAAGPAAWARLGRRRRRALALALAAALAAGSLAAALWLSQRRPRAMLVIWGRTQLAGFAIDRLFALEELRADLALEGIQPPPRPGARPRDVVLVTIDTVRADRTPPYGGAARMPALSRLAGQGAVFEWALSPGNVTRRSLPSMMLGLSPPRVRGRVVGWALRLDPRHVLVAERLRAAGYDTAGFFCCASQFGPEHHLGLIRGLSHLVIERDGERLAGMAARWLARRAAGPAAPPLFLWLHFIEPHDWETSYPVAPRAGERPARGAESYDQALSDADRALGIVLETAWSPPRRDRTYVLVASDHGEGLGDHGYRTHASSLYNSEIRVPLIVVGPDIQPRRVAQPVGLTDLAPTIIDLAGFAPPGMPAMDGVSLGPVLRGERSRAADGEAYAAMMEDRSVSTSERAVIAGRYKLIWRAQASAVELYDLATDPDERRDLAGGLPGVESGLKARLAARRATDGVSPFD